MFRSKKRVKSPVGRAREEAQNKEAVRKSMPSLLLMGVAIVLTPCFFLTPEGAIREGDSLATAALFLLMTTIALWWNYRVNLNSSREDKTSSNKDTFNVDALSSRRALLVRLADVALVCYLLWTTLSYLHVVLWRVGDIRLSTNAYWTFLTPALWYFFVRFFSGLFTRRAIIAVCALLVAYSFAEGVFSAYSYAVITPQSQAAYRADPDKVLRESGFDFPAGSAERLLFEKRLLDSTEPTGTYGLANTLGGVLAPILILAALAFPWWKLFLQAFNNNATQRGTLFISGCVWLMGLLVTFIVLVATKSRSSILACVVGIAVWIVCNVLESCRDNRRIFLRILGVGAVLFGVFAVVIGGSFMMGIIDREVFLEAGKSLGYRLDYWRATSAMICDHPWLGIGPGEFQSVYARYILPTASEFIADPHNFAFEIAALFGIPALLGFVTFLLLVFVIGARDCYRYDARISTRQPSLNSDIREREELLAEVRSERVFSAITWGAALGTLATIALSLLHSAPLTWRFYPIIVLPLALTFVATFAMTNSATNQELKSMFIPMKVVLAVLVTSLVNLCVAGGFGYFPVAVPLFVLLAVVVNGAETKPETLRLRRSNSNNKRSLVLFSVSILVLFVFYFTAFLPRNAGFLLLESGAPDRAALETIASGNVGQIDAYSATVAQQSYFYAGANYLKLPTPENKRKWEQLRTLVKRNSPNSAPIREACGNSDWGLFLQMKSRTEFAEAAIDQYREAVELSPTDVRKREKLAKALMSLERNDEAFREAKKTLEYDALNPHEDRKLSDMSRREFQLFVEKNTR